MADNATIAIPKDVLQPIINAHVSKAILEALGGQALLIEEAVRATLEQKVDSGTGKPESYDRAGSPTFLKWLVTSALREATTAAVREYIANDVEKIKALVAKEIKNQRSPMTKALIDGIAKMAVDGARYHVKVELSGVDQTVR